MDWLLILLKLMLINMVLSGDNALVIAMSSRNLPVTQRGKAVLWGSLGAVLLRVVLVFAAVLLLRIPFIQALGAVMLLFIAFKLIARDDSQSRIKDSSTLWSAIWTIILADFVMSLDNVLAIAAIAEGNYIVIFVGIALSIPLIVWGSEFVMRLLIKFPLLNYIGAGILGYTGGEMILNDAKLAALFADTPAYMEYVIPVLCTFIVLLPGFLKVFSRNTLDRL